VATAIAAAATALAARMAKKSLSVIPGLTPASCDAAGEASTAGRQCSSLFHSSPAILRVPMNRYAKTIAIASRSWMRGADRRSPVVPLSGKD